MGEKELRLGKKKISILVSPKFVKNSFIKSSSFSAIFVWYYPVTTKNKFCLVCRSSLFSRLFSKQIVFKLPEKNIEM